MENANYMYVEPNSHFWTDLNQILQSIKNHYYLMEYVPKENEYVQEPYLTREYILTGLSNSIKNGYKIGSMSGLLTIDIIKNDIFVSLDDMILFVSNRPFELKFDYMDFERIIKNTLNCGLNLTNGLKMERKEIYKRIDGERDYQDASWGHRRTLDGTPDEEKPVAEWVNYIEYHVSKAKERIYHLDTKGATAELRKVAALAVRAMEIHGCPERDGKIWNPLMGTTPEEQAKEKSGDCTCSDCDCKKE